MIITDEDALICDMAETYQIYDIYSMPADLIATLAFGLRDNSRIKTILLNMTMPLEDYLMAAIFDCVNWLCWTHTKDAEHGNKQPQRIVDILTHKEEQQTESDFLVFDSGKAFEEARARLLKG